MSREYTVFQFDVDEAAVRRLLERIPGVSPMPPDEAAASDGRDGSARDGAAPTTTDATTGNVTEVERDETGTPAPDAAGVEAHLADSAKPDAHRAGARKWTGPSTPWPGAPSDEEEESGGIVDRLREHRLLIAGGALAVAVAGAVAAWFLKFRDGDEPERTGGSASSRPRGRTGESAPSDAGRNASAREPPADDSESRSYPVDAAPVIGIAFLAVASIVLRRVRSRSET